MTMFSQDQKNWAKKELETIMNTGNNKTRYKQLVSVPQNLENAENALLFIAHKKDQFYQKAAKGEVLSSLGWVEKYPEFAKNTLVLQHLFVDLMEIPILP